MLQFQYLIPAIAALILSGCPLSGSSRIPVAGQAGETADDGTSAAASDQPAGEHPDEPKGTAVSETHKMADEPLSTLVSRTLKQNLQRRELSSSTHGAWQVLHGVLAYGSEFEIQTASGSLPALPYLLSGSKVNGFEAEPGDKFGTSGRPGLRMAMQPSTKIGQGHRDQWLAVIAQAELPLDTEIKGKNHTFTLEDWIRQAEYDVPRNLEREFSWTLIAFTAYRSTDHRWLARDGSRYSTESLLASELQQSLTDSVCGGTHRLIGMAMALNQRKREGLPITGVWAEADAVIKAAIELAKLNQNPDGSYSVAYLHRPGWTRDLGETLGSTGHVLEFLALAAPTQTLFEPWVERSVRRLCDVLDQCADVDLECGVLYHALHGLSEYQKRTSPST